MLLVVFFIGTVQAWHVGACFIAMAQEIGGQGAAAFLEAAGIAYAARHVQLCAVVAKPDAASEGGYSLGGRGEGSTAFPLMLHGAAVAGAPAGAAHNTGALIDFVDGTPCVVPPSFELPFPTPRSTAPPRTTIIERTACGAAETAGVSPWHMRHGRNLPAASALAFTFTTLASVATLTSTTLAFALIAFATLAAAASLAYRLATALRGISPEDSVYGTPGASTTRELLAYPRSDPRRTPLMTHYGAMPRMAMSERAAGAGERAGQSRW